MDILNIDFNSMIPDVIEAYCHVYGEEYRPIISYKINKCIILPYYNPSSIDKYITHIKYCKRLEFALEFLRRIGLDVPPYNNVSEMFNSDVIDLLELYIGNPFYGMSINSSDVPLKVFDCNDVDNLDKSDSDVINKKIKLVNHLRSKNEEPLTVDNFLEFTKTDEYRKLLEKINELQLIHSELVIQCHEWEKCLIPYEEYVDNEYNRKKVILESKKLELFEEIYPNISYLFNDTVLNKSRSEQQNIFLEDNIGYKSNIELFSYEDMEKLKSADVSGYEKYVIVINQLKYLEKFGIIIPNLKHSEFIDNIDLEIQKHFEFLNRENICKYIPSYELVSYVKEAREKKYGEGLKDYTIAREDFIKIMKKLGNNPNNIDSIYNMLNGDQVCVVMGINELNEEMALMFWEPIEVGFLFGIFLHECCHVIDSTYGISGFDIGASGGKLDINPYDNRYRKYEKFNETLTDIFTLEALDFLQSQGIYHIESKKFTGTDVSNYNTSKITKNLLDPLVKKYRNLVISAKVNFNPDELIRYIGVNNFEDLVDAVNKVDYLSRNGLFDELNNNPNDSLVIEYQEQLDRVMQIYEKIDVYNEQIEKNSEVSIVK